MGETLLFLTKNGLYRYETGTRSFRKADYPGNCDLISGYYDEPNRKLWLGTFSSGVQVVDMDREEVTECEGLPHVPVRDFCAYDASTMLVGADGGGVYRADRKQGDHAELFFDASETHHGTLHGNGIYALLKDCWGNLFIGSYAGGIDIARPMEGGGTKAIYAHIPNDEQSLVNNHVNCIEEDGARLFMGTDNGISIRDSRTGQFRHTAQGMVVLDIRKTRDGRLLAATFGNGVVELADDGAVRPIYTVRNGSLRDNHVYCLYEDRNGSLWMGCLEKKLVQRCGDAFRYYDVENVKAIVQLPDGRMAVGTVSGVKLVSAGSDRIEELSYMPEGVPDVNRYVLDLIVDEERLWIATDGGGIYVYDLTDRTCVQITVDDGLPSNIVNDITADSTGRIWAGTDRGLAFIPARQLLPATNVNDCYGLFREYVQGAGVRLSNGRLIFGTTEGAVEIDPGEIQNIDYKAALALVGLTCAGNDGEEFRRRIGQMLRQGAVELDYDSRTFELHFEAINLCKQFDIAYRYRIGRGEWSKPVDEQYIRFVNLEPGTHTLQLRCVSRTTLHVLDERELVIVIGEPWWNSGWMRCLYALLLGGAFFGAWRVYELHTKYMRLVVSSPSVNRPIGGRTADEGSEEPDSNDRDQFIDKTTRLIVAHLADSDFSIDRLCREMAMSRTLFYVKLKSCTGKSPQDFIRIIRMERAAALLRNGLPVSEAADRVGFDNAKYFSTVFKKYFGVSPSKYR